MLLGRIQVRGTIRAHRRGQRSVSRSVLWGGCPGEKGDTASMGSLERASRCPHRQAESIPTSQDGPQQGALVATLRGCSQQEGPGEGLQV